MRGMLGRLALSGDYSNPKEVGRAGLHDSDKMKIGNGVEQRLLSRNHRSICCGDLQNKNKIDITWFL